ncbi:MAG: hypothetical protein HOG03_24415 [Desulfobacula sp.]|jgi:tetratricopeptide (TPR) repeat protein|uniref:tetratricopeptide repeat protein n=1 Tax=Desulfobacula sp. TaxID=2593537 RepID=UPI001D7C538C|nr:hypothetical protein [Desulfobacula sp.]MBT6341663.1 hypothetical protein [Desulfobacula sp.]MBT6751757.1 hypothetical protein [Desulfobacula sp.]
MVTLEAAARIIQKPENETRVQTQKVPESDLFDEKELFGIQAGQYLKKSRNRILADIEELTRGNRWDDIISLYHPAEEKIPELVQAGMDLRVREKAAFALGQVRQFDEAIKVLKGCVKLEPDNFYSRASLAYTAYNSLYAAKNKEIFLAGNSRVERIALAHENFQKAQSLRPSGVTNFYRQAMLYSQIENKPKPALVLFNTACSNWENLSEKEQARRHQEKKNYIKSLYRSASLLLNAGNGFAALEQIKKCLEQDEKTNTVDLGFKYFALGKVNFHIDDYQKARDALLFALQSSPAGKPVDFIYELLARTYLAMGKTDRALEAIGKVPERARRPYYRWTEADVLCSAGRYEHAKKVLLDVVSRDKRSRHISLLRLAKIDYTLKSWEYAAQYAKKAVAFFREKWGNAYYEGLFWQALCTFKSGRVKESESLLIELEDQCRFFPKLDRLATMIRGTAK